MAKRIKSPRLSSLRSVASRLIAFFELEARSFPWRDDRATSFDRIITEVLLQQTRAETVATHYPMFRKRFKDWEALHQASEEEIQDQIRPLGLWRKRAKALKALSSEVANREYILPKSRAEIESLPAVGQYVANAIELFCFDRPRPLLDVNFARVLERYYGPRTHSDIRHDPFLQSTAQRLVSLEDPIKLNWAILDLGATVCTSRNPKCRSCPLKRGCKYP